MDDTGVGWWVCLVCPGREIDIDLTSPEYHPYARDTKDVVAGAVLVVATTAAIYGFFIFGKYLLPLLFS